ncbi:hypothetical protein JYB64_04610 [Algoriphagus aestuarii]|nr:hypothetical protein [Algoriphagus aestuarii]
MPVFLLILFLAIDSFGFNQSVEYKIELSKDQKWYLIESVQNQEFEENDYQVPEGCVTSVIDNHANFKRQFAHFFTNEELQIFQKINLIGKMTFNDNGQVEQIKFMTKSEPTPYLQYFQRIEKLYRANVDLNDTPCKTTEGKVFSLHGPLYIKN